jgi:uncharacterized linocin/CFP29 family protein
MTTNDPRVPWTDEQWARVNQVVQEEASRARVAASFLPLIGPLPGGTDFVRSDVIAYVEPPDVIAAAQVEITSAIADYNAAMAVPDIAAAVAAQQRIAGAQALAGANRIRIDDRDTIQLATMQVRVPVRGAQIADPDMTSVLALFRRAANVLARLEDAVVFRGLVPDAAQPGRFIPPAGVAGLHGIWEITGGQVLNGLWTATAPWTQWVPISWWPPRGRDTRLVRGVAKAIGRLEETGHFGPFAAVLDQKLFLVAQSPSPALVLPQDRIIPFLSGGPLLRSSTLDNPFIGSGVVVALGGAPVELVVATDVRLQFLQLTSDPVFVFRVHEKMALRIKEPEAIIQLAMW